PAYALGLLSRIERSLTAAQRMLLLTLAIIDDVVAILVIAFYYSGGVAAAGLLVIAAGVIAVLLLQWLGVRAALAYLLPGAVVWIGMLRAGLHPTLAGVLLGLMTPASSEFGRQRAAPAPHRADSPLVRLEARLHPWVAFAIMPLFAMANAGVSLTGVMSLAAAKLAVLVASTLAAALALVFGRLQAARGRR